MGDLTEQQNEPLASISKEEAQSPRGQSAEESQDEVATLPADNAVTPGEGVDAAATSATAGELVASFPTSPLPQVGEVASEAAPTSSECTEVSSPLPALVTEAAPQPQHEDPPHAAGLVEDPLETGVPSAKQDKGKGRAVSPPELAEPKQPAWRLSPQNADGLFRVPSLALTNASESRTVLLPASPQTTKAPVRGVGQVRLTVSEGSDDYPKIVSPRTIRRRGSPGYEPHRNLPRPQNMSDHRSVTLYAGNPLFRLCKSVPYILGPLVLVTRLQLIVETPTLLPDEVKDLVASSGLDVTLLAEYDLALLNILGCLWND
ncbi:hypothetical protein BU25DRAFT_163139 [Macroventuria anomochaeta]|uniref:Uncharacterized protein n=1 Tax=Macroventuria anomochaeta TaxID=301207 RepID=A0ACB6RQF7_9PLEO|nr:uncharacterized protein BU25DRAFT_163139 [Macroventuria anomochaeta]KAF2624200.1 hypothetical protein BU25DRAFT_163139 [Macroventuria anomochaeta]